jgi:glycosyltransferase involved in cell wall biosynthesis
VQVDPMNVAEIRKAIAALLSDELALGQMSAEARNRVMSDFRWEEEGRRLVEFCSKLMVPRPTSPATVLQQSSPHSPSS